MVNKQSHYFDENPKTQHQLREFTVKLGEERYRFVSDSSTFSRNRLDHGSQILIEACLDLEDFPENGRILDLGCGWGPVGTIIYSFFPEIAVSFSDVNERAVELSRENFRRNCPGAKAEFHHSDGFAKIPGTYDMIILNPPIRAGKDLVYRLYAESFTALNPGGRLLIVIQRKQGAKSSQEELERLFGVGQVTDIARKSGYHVYAAEKQVANGQGLVGR